MEKMTMKEHMRFSVTYWHTFRGTGSDPFGAGTMVRPWEDGTDSVENACNRARAAFEFIEKVGAPYYAFHDRDVARRAAMISYANFGSAGGEEPERDRADFDEGECSVGTAGGEHVCGGGDGFCGETAVSICANKSVKSR